jgi:hypothetical protein
MFSLKKDLIGLNLIEFKFNQFFSFIKVETMLRQRSLIFFRLNLFYRVASRPRRRTNKDTKRKTFALRQKTKINRRGEVFELDHVLFGVFFLQYLAHYSF